MTKFKYDEWPRPAGCSRGSTAERKTGGLRNMTVEPFSKKNSWGCNKDRKDTRSKEERIKK